MSRDEEPKDVRLFDIRTVERNIKKGLITRKEYDKYLKSLPDAAEKAAPPEAASDFDDDDLDDDLDDEEDDEDEDNAPAAG